MNTVTYQIPAIHCAHCIHTIKNELSELEGVKYVDGKFEDKRITVTYEPPADPEKIENYWQKLITP